MAEPSNAELMVHLSYIREAADKTNAHLATLNGRVGDTEQKIAVLESTASDAKTSGAKWGAILGAVITGAAMAWQFLSGQ